MKKSAFILLFLLASLPALMSRGAEAGAAAASDLRQTVKNSSISAQHSDFVATETFQLSVPAPSRALRKSNERSSRTIHEMPVLYCKRYFASVRHDLSQSVASLRPDAHRPLPSHSADYLKFGILSFSHPFPLRRHDTPAPEAIVRVCIYGYLRVGLHPSGGILRGRTFPTGSVPPAEEGLRSRTETCAPATNPFSHP